MVSVFCGSGVVRQANDAVASERSIFSKQNHDYNNYNYYKRVFRAAVNTYVSLPIFRGLDARGGKNYEQAHTHTRGTMGCRLSQKSTLQNHIYRNTFTEFSVHLAISSDDLAKSSTHLAISSDDLAISNPLYTSNKVPYELKSFHAKLDSL